MLDRMVVGEVPRKHHIAFRGPGGELRFEECITRLGFDGPFSLLYHLRKPHLARIADISHGWSLAEAAPEQALARRHFKSQDLPVSDKPAIDARIPMLMNDDMVISVVKPSGDDPVWFSNADSDELFYIFEGTGTIHTPMGTLRYEPDDYVCIPRGLLYRTVPDPGSQYWLHMECFGQLGLLPQWRNDVGQLRMDAPYCHRDFRRPTFEGPTDEGPRDLLVKQGGAFHGFRYDASPCDVIGWDGTVYPWVFPMLNFQPRAGLVHLPPDWHGTFKTRGALICSFVPRAVDFHEDAIPCPYPHSSVDCDEFLFYCRGNFTSRRGVGPGSISFHPRGIPHGPHPGAYEGSIGHTHTNEMAVMVDTFGRLLPTTQALAIEDAGYHDSFIG